MIALTDLQSNARYYRVVDRALSMMKRREQTRNDTALREILDLSSFASLRMRAGSLRTCGENLSHPVQPHCFTVVTQLERQLR